MDKGKIIDRIQKLLALSQGTSSQHEAESAMAKVQELLMKYNLEMEEVEAAGSEEERTYIREYAPCEYQDWVRSLYQAVAAGNLCHTIYEPDERKVAVIGNPSNVAITVYSVAWLVPRLRQMATTFWSFYPGDEKEREWKAGFLIGVVNGIRSKVSEQLRVQQENDPNTKALVVKKSAELEKVVKDFYPYLVQGRRQTTYSEGYGIGYRQGRKVSVQPGIEQRDSRLLR